MGATARSSALYGVLGAACLLAASASAALVLRDIPAAVAEGSISIDRTPSDANSTWQLRPLSDQAMRLFIRGIKGPRADIDPDTDEEAGPAKIEFASVQMVAPQRSGASSIAASASEPEAKDVECLATAIYYEARGDTIEAQIAVGQTVLNRVRSGAYPRSICGVVYQKGERDGTCQYSFVCDGLLGMSKIEADWDLARDLAHQLLAGAAWLAEIGDATHCHPITEHPPWARYLQRVKRIGGVVFYRTDFAAQKLSTLPVSN